MSVPFDSSDPEIRLLLKHVRLQALTPMAILVNLLANIISSYVVHPSAERIQVLYATPFNSKPFMLQLYWLGTFVFLIGYCSVLFIAVKRETKDTLVTGVGFRLMFVQWLMAFNAVAFTLKWFIASLIFTSLSLALLIWIHVSLHWYPITSARPLDTAFIHAPLRLLLAVTFLQDFPQVLFIVLGWHFNLVKDEEDYNKYAWQAVAFIGAFNALGLVNVGWRLDVIWAVGAVWLLIGQMIETPKAAQVFGSLTAFTVLYPVVLIVMMLVWRRVRRDGAEGRIRLGEDPSEEDEVARARARAHGQQSGSFA